MSGIPLKKAIALLNDVWLAYREEMFADQTDQIVWKSPRRLILRSGCFERTEKKRPDTSSPLMAFPKHLCQNPLDRVIMLNFLQCNVAVTHMQCILEWLLKDVARKIEVAVFLVKDPPLVVTLEPDGSPPISNIGYRHVCWRVTLKTGEVCAIDLTAAQYGWPDQICPWQECLNDRCEGLLRIGFRDDEQVAPLIAPTLHIPGFTPPKVDNYYASVREHFSRTMTPHLESLKVDDFFVQGSDKESTETVSLVEEVKAQVEAATMAADAVWNMFSWDKVLLEKSEAAEEEKRKSFTEAMEKLGV